MTAANLRNFINVAAIWQIASVIVAQKHLADISKKLDEIKNGIKGISLFLDNQRKARIQSCYDYLRQAYQAIQEGEFPNSVRIELENCERNLLEIQRHLECEFKQKVDRRVESKEMAGSAELTSDINNKIDELQLLTDDMKLCLNARIAGWYVMSLYPGESQLKLARSKSILESIDSFISLGPYAGGTLHEEISNVNAFFNTEETLRERRDILNGKRSEMLKNLGLKAQKTRRAFKKTERLLLEKSQPIRMLLEYDNGKLVGAREG